MQKLKRKYIVNEKGKKTAAIIPMEEYEELLEDLHDISIVAERRDEPTIPFDKLKERLRKDGII
ncbi:MAG: hypothetical protein WA130_17645 [Candidatus Methanoperedens sp.]